MICFLNLHCPSPRLNGFPAHSLFFYLVHVFRVVWWRTWKHIGLHVRRSGFESVTNLPVVLEETLCLSVSQLVPPCPEHPAAWIRKLVVDAVHPCAPPKLWHRWELCKYLGGGFRPASVSREKQSKMIIPKLFSKL